MSRNRWLPEAIFEFEIGCSGFYSVVAEWLDGKDLFRKLG